MKRGLIFTIIMASFLIFSILYTYAKGVQADIANNVLRLHVIANSDIEEDQALKLCVRDEIVKNTKDLFKDSKSPSETKRIANQNLEAIKNAAQKKVRDLGYDYKVNVEMGYFPFPTKTYGGVMLPAGSYDAVKVTIGEGGGQNWWCVLFPPLCFVNGVNAEMQEEAKEKLKQSLTEEEYALITENNAENTDVQIKFKIIEILAPLFNK